jgi:antitoxin component YwqK of YwqJK toxin-antitoxin module
MNKALIFFLAFFCTGSLVFAQQADNYKQDTTTLYQRAKGFSNDPIRSKWRQEVKKEGDIFVLNLYDKKDVLQERISFADKNLSERKGPYTRYQNGIIKEEGNYDKGYKNGEWKRYYLNKQLSETINYAWDKVSGSRKMFYKDGKLALDEVYTKSGSLDTGKYFDENGNAVDLAYVMKAMN